MRMRRKHNLNTRMDACEGYWIPVTDEPLNIREAKNNPEYLDFNKLFNNNNPVELDIGCGMGHFVCKSAKLHPEINFLAIERITNVMITAVERAKNENLTNVRFICINAACIPHYINEHSISRIYLNFSNPLPKKGNVKQRLTSEKFLETYKSILTEKGEIHMKTDNMNFFEFSIEEFSKSGFKLRNISLDLHNSGIENNIVTEHEKKFSDMGLPIYRLEAYL